MSSLVNKEVLNNNISQLKKKDPATLNYVKIENFKIPSHIKPVRDFNGVINLIIKSFDNQNISVHVGDAMLSRSSRIFDYSDLEDYDIIFYIGLGLGYNCFEILREIKKKPRIVILEPFLDIFNVTLRLVDLTEVLSNPRVDLFVGPTISVPRIAKAYKNLIPIGKNHIYTLPSYRLLFQKDCTRFEEALKNNIRAYRDSWHTTKKFGQQMISNTLANMPSMFPGTSFGALKEKFKGLPAICIAAGPSLDKTITDVKKIKDQALIIACDSSVNALAAVGLQPHIVVTTDIFRTNFEKIKNRVDHLRDSILIYGIESNPDNVRKFLGPKRVAVSSSSRILLDWLDPKWNLNCGLPFLTSVSQMAIFSTIALGADPVVLVGMDLSYPKGNSHSAEAVTQEYLNLNKMIKIGGVNGNKIFSSSQLVADKIILEGEIAKSETRFINTSIDGALIKGTENKTLNEILTTKIKNDVDVNRLLSEIAWTSSVSSTEAVAELNEMLQKVFEFKDICDDKEKLINDSIAMGDLKETKEQMAERLKDIKRDFENFMQTNGLILGIIELAIGQEIHEILKKRECIEAKDYKDQIRKIWDETDLIRYHYKAYRKGADFFYNQLNKTTIDLEKAQFLKHTASADNIRDQWNKHQKIGRHYAKIEEIWQAEREYLNAIQIRPEDPSSWLELAQMFADSGLWRPARDYIENACRLFPNDNEIMDLKAKIEDKIDGIMDQIKDAWVAGDKETTRRLLNGYLLLCPGDEQANLLKDVLQELDETLAADSPVVKQQKSSDYQFDELLANAALCIEKLEFEQAIGIIEGLIKNFPQNAAVLREKIGDIRMLQQDYPSAVWNYDQVLKFVGKNFEIRAKLNRAKQELEYLNNDCTQREIYIQKPSYT